jgi:hypothetical protein
MISVLFYVNVVVVVVAILKLVPLSLFVNGLWILQQLFNSLYAVRVLLRMTVSADKGNFILLLSMILIILLWLGSLYFSLRKFYLIILTVCDIHASHAMEAFFVVCDGYISGHVGCVNFFVLGVLTFWSINLSWFLQLNLNLFF